MSDLGSGGHPAQAALVYSGEMQAMFATLSRWVEGDARHQAVGLLLTDAQFAGRRRRLREIDAAYLLARLTDVPEVAAALEASGLASADVDAVVEQLLDDPDLHTEDDAEPEMGPDIGPILRASEIAGHHRLAPFLRALAEAIPPPLGFVRSALGAHADAIADAVDPPRARDAKGNATLDGWTPPIQRVIALAQHVADQRTDIWVLHPFHVLLALLGSKDYREMLARRGLTFEALDAHIATLPPPKEPPFGWRAKPAGEPSHVGLAMHALLVRAERFAAEDRSDVNVGHLLAALRASKTLRPVIDAMQL